MNHTTTEELKEILKELDMECPKMDMSPELRAAMGDMERFNRFLISQETEITLEGVIKEIGEGGVKTRMSPELLAAMRGVEEFLCFLSGQRFDPLTQPYSCLMEIWFTEEKKKGLVDFKLTLINKDKDLTVEMLSKQLWRALHAESVEISPNDMEL